jgi:hypothetical protein
MLERDIEIGEKVFEFSELREMIEREDVRIEIVDAVFRMLECWVFGFLDIGIYRLIYRLEHLDKARFIIEVSTISSRIL